MIGLRKYLLITLSDSKPEIQQMIAKVCLTTIQKSAGIYK